MGMMDSMRETTWFGFRVLDSLGTQRLPSARPLGRSSRSRGARTNLSPGDLKWLLSSQTRLLGPRAGGATRLGPVIGMHPFLPMSREHLPALSEQTNRPLEDSNGSGRRYQTIRFVPVSVTDVVAESAHRNLP